MSLLNIKEKSIIILFVFIIYLGPKHRKRINLVICSQLATAIGNLKWKRVICKKKIK